METWRILILCAAVSAGIVVQAIFWKSWLLSRRKKNQQKLHYRVWCMHRMNGRAAFVLRDDYDRASREFWKSHQKSEGRSFDYGHVDRAAGKLVMVPEDRIVIVRDRDPEYYTIFQGVFIERREFYIPGHIHMPFDVAFVRMHGHVWDGKHIPW